MGWWLAGAADGAAAPQDRIKRFDPRFWTVNFPRPMLASVVTTGPAALRVDLRFLRADDVAGLIWESEDRFDHPLTAYATARDYRGCVLRFRWRGTGAVRGLDAVDGPVLTVEGRDAAGVARTWYVRLWNHAVGAPGDAVVTLDFDALASGFAPGGPAVFAGDVDRLFLSLTPAGYSGADAPLAASEAAQVTIDEIACDGPGSTLAIADTMVPPHRLRLTGGYDDSYHLTPARLLRMAVALGYRGAITHYVGMSHWFPVAWDGSRFVAGSGIAGPAAAWHADFLARCAELGFEPILSLSFELLAQHCPDAWMQRAADGTPGLTGWSPPSALLVPGHAGAMAWLRDGMLAFAGLAAAAGLPVRVQIGEPWWWTGFGAARPLCAYDATTVAAWTAETGAPPPLLANVLTAPNAAGVAWLGWLGARLGAATLALRDAVKAAHPGAEVLLLFYAPQAIGDGAAHLAALNMPAAWAHPAFDTLQLEDYDFVTAGDRAASRRAAAAVTDALGYPQARQHYFSGFVLNAADRAQWAAIDTAAATARARGVAEVFVWALPQVARDGFVHFDSAKEAGVQAFHDVRFPLEAGLGATVAPGFSTVVATSASGFEQRNAQWADARLSFDAGLGVRSEADLATVAGFFRARRGRACGFRFRDPTDWSSNGAAGTPGPLDQRIGTGDGVTTRFRLCKRYGEGADAQLRLVTRPEAGTVRVAVGGVEAAGGWALAEGGWIEFASAPLAGAAVTAGFAFDVPVRFAEDRLEMSLATFRAGEAPSIPLVEIREA
ncbi:MAG: DUF2460 domain-containing protein [Alphaproteobacteria bacterium]|nr:DUF2460 domain-containing protein [Alphaproteobacteria bacterium]